MPFVLAKCYITYRYKRALVRQSNTTDDKILSLIECTNEEAKQENANKNPVITSTQRDYMAGEVSKDLSERLLLPADIVKAHEEGIIHFHDMDYYAQHMHNCDLVNLEDMLQNGTVITGTLIEKPHSFSTACNIATQIIAQVASSQYGGQSSLPWRIWLPFVQVSPEKIRRELEAEFADCKVDMDEETLSKLVDRQLEKRDQARCPDHPVSGCYPDDDQRAGSLCDSVYVPGRGENEQERDDLGHDHRRSPAPALRRRQKTSRCMGYACFSRKLIYVLEEDNIHEGSKYYELTKLAAKCTAKRMVPDYISEKIMKELKGGDVYTCMGCRSFLTPDRFTDAGIGNIANAGNYKPGEHKYYGRFNQGVVTVNLVDIGLSAHGDMDAFWQIFDERMELCHRALRCRHERLLGTPSDVAPILWQYGALARLEKGEVIDKLLYNGYSTLSLGYAGLWECVRSLNGKKLTEPEGENLVSKS